MLWTLDQMPFKKIHDVISEKIHSEQSIEAQPLSNFSKDENISNLLKDFEICFISHPPISPIIRQRGSGRENWIKTLLTASRQGCITSAPIWCEFLNSHQIGALVMHLKFVYQVYIIMKNANILYQENRALEKVSIYVFLCALFFATIILETAVLGSYHWKSIKTRSSFWLRKLNFHWLCEESTLFSQTIIYLMLLLGL